MAKNKKKSLSEISQQRHIQRDKKQLNPFEVHINKDKLKVLGKKSKTDRGLPGISRAKAINKRKGTLLQEYKLKNKDNVFLDKRIGEKNSAMSSEDKAMARFAAERIKAHKKNSIFNLNDEEVLTHRGQTLEEIEKFDDPRSDDEFSDSENVSGKLDNKFVEAHFGGGVLSRKDSSMSRKDLIDQLIAESKKRKAEKQKIREETMDLTEKLDSEWKDLLPIVAASKASNESNDDSTQKSKVDDYDLAVRQLKFEARGNPSDRLKSEEEIVKEEKEKLEVLEADRLARMKGFINSNNEIKHKSADDLDDGFVLEKINEELEGDKEHELSANKESELTDNDTDDEDEEGDDDEENNADDNETENNDDVNGNNDDVNHHNKNINNDCETENSEQKKLNEHSDGDESSPEEDNLSDLKESDESSEDETQPVHKSVKFAENLTQVSEQKTGLNGSLKSILKVENNTPKQEESSKNREQEIKEDLLKRKEIMEKARKELPYTYNAPQDLEELQKLLENHNAEYQAVIIERMIKCNHWSLNQENKEKMLNLFKYLTQHIMHNFTMVDNAECTVKSFQIFDRLCPHLYDLAHIDPQSTKQCIQEILKSEHEEFSKNIKKYPKIDVLVLFKIISILFPTSDFRHPIVTPCIVFMSQILLRCKVRSKTDISKGLFICTLFLEFTALSKRFVPSVINFLRGVIYTATPKLRVHGKKIIPPFKVVGEASNLLILEEDQTEMKINPTATLMIANDLVDDKLDDNFKMRALLTAVNLTNEFKKQLEELDAAYSIFEPIFKLLDVNSFEDYPENVREHIQRIGRELESLRNKKLEYLVGEKKKPKPLRQYEPRIEKIYDNKKHRPMSKEKAEREKLLHKLKQERKGAMREIRKDRAFLAKVQIKQQIRSDEERKRKVKEIFGEAALQQSELKKLKRNK